MRLEQPHFVMRIAVYNQSTIRIRRTIFINGREQASAQTSFPLSSVFNDDWKKKT